MTAIRYEFVTLDNMLIRRKLGTPGKLTVTSTATVAGSRPVVPTLANNLIWARLTAIDGNVIVDWGADPTAAQNNGILIPIGTAEAIRVASGEKLSFVELT